MMMTRESSSLTGPRTRANRLLHAKSCKLSAIGWILRIASWSAMIWLLARNATPLEPEPDAA